MGLPSLPLGVGPPIATSIESTSSLPTQKRSRIVFGAACGSGLSCEPPEAKTQRTVDEERSEGRTGKGPLSVLALTLHQALPSLINNPFDLLGRYRKVREVKVLMGGCDPPEDLSKFSISPSCLQGSGLGLGCRISSGGHRAVQVVVSHQPSLMPGLESRGCLKLRM